MDDPDVMDRAQASYREADEWWQRTLRAAEHPDLLRGYASALAQLSVDRFSAITSKAFPFGDPRMVAVSREIRRRYVDELGRLWRKAVAGRTRRHAMAADDPDVALERSLQRYREKGLL